MTWTPIIEAGAAKTSIGVAEQNWVFAASNHELVILRERPLAGLALVEQGYFHLRRTIVESLVQQGIPPEREATFPYAEIASLGLLATDYWCQKALEWVLEEGALVDKLRPELERVSNDQGQRLRHLASRILRSRQGLAR